jgi:CheY-like chemotaxis protein
MDGQVKQFGDTAKSLARNPLGIIALFIVMVYGLAALVTTFGSSLSSNDKTALIYFLVTFPILVLVVFAWLVSQHSNKLFAPSDFRDEDNYVKMQTVARLTVAAAKNPEAVSETGIQRIIESVQYAKPRNSINEKIWNTHILWVDDRPENNIHERSAFESAGFEFTLALSTDDAIRQILHHQFGAIISDMGRKEGPREGYVLLDKLRMTGDQTPLFFYASSGSTEHRRETIEHGGQGCTNDARELFAMVTRAIYGEAAARGSLR